VGAVLALFPLFRLPLCPFAAFTGHPCPGCGLTRATLALAEGHLHDAITIHPLSPLVSPLAAGCIGYAVLVYVRTGKWPSLAGKGRIALAAGIVLWMVVVAVWIARFFGAFGGPVPV